MSLSASGENSEAFNRFRNTFSLLATKESILRGLNFKPRSDDVFLVTYPKCGTTWMEQIVHQLRSGGDMSFEDIHDVFPPIGFAYDLKIDLEAEQNYQPRCFKTHSWYPSCPKGAAKYIVVCREPCAAFYSFFNYMQGWLFQPGDISLHEFVENVSVSNSLSSLMGSSYFEHLLSWWEHRNDSNVLFLFYEDMKEDLENVVRKVAGFIEIHDEERIKKAVEMSSFEFMKAHESKFSTVRIAQYRNKEMGLPEEAGGSKVVTGSATKGRELMDEKTEALIQAKWMEVVCKQIGFQDFNQLRSAFHQEKTQDS